MARRGGIETPIPQGFQGYIEGKDNYPNYPRVEQPTAFHQIVAGLAQGWMNPGWNLDHIREWNGKDHGNRSNLAVVVVFKNPNAPEAPLQKAFVPELQDIFAEHFRYLDRNRIRREKFYGIYYLNRMTDEIRETVSGFNVDVGQVRTHGAYRNKLVFVAFEFTDLDKQHNELGEKIESLEEYRRKISERLHGEQVR